MSYFLQRLVARTAPDINLCQQVLAPTYQRMVPLFVPVFRLSPDDFVTGLPTYRTHSTPIGRCAVELVDITEHCLYMELFSEVELLLISGLPELPAATSDF
jgi:hypothetical protein